MIVTPEIIDVRRARWSDSSLSWGLVPTMGFLHEGHLSLVRRARDENDRVGVSIYVNPTQFAPNEDLDKYPRNLEKDLALLEKEKVDLVFIPTDLMMYPSGFQTTVEVMNITKTLEGAHRTTHFQGVVTVVTKLLNIFQPTRAYFGQKDAQQAVVVRRLVSDLNFYLDIVICPIIRELDGLAMSSRNARLTKDQRASANVLFRALSTAAGKLESGERNAQLLRQIMVEIVNSEKLARIEYASAADPHTLTELEIVENEVLLSLAVYFGDVRLIDNMLLEV